MSKETRNSRDKLTDDHQDIVGGDVYLNPQTLQDRDDSYAGTFRKATEATKSPSYKAKLVLPDELVAIGDFVGDSLDDSTRVTSRFYMDVKENWVSELRIEIKAWIIKPAPVSQFKAEQELVHTWIIRLNATSGLNRTPIFQMLAPSTKHAEMNSPLYVFYQQFCVVQPDEYAKRIRQQKNLGYLAINFIPSQVHTEGILHNAKHLGDFTFIQTQLQKMFCTPSSNPVTLKALIVCQEETSFLTAYGDIMRAFEENLTQPPYTRFFNNLKDAKPKIQKGQVTERADRPLLNLQRMKSYPNSHHMWTAEGMAVIYDEENEYEDANQALRVECEMRVLKTTAGADRLYIALLRLPTNFGYRFAREGRLSIIIEGEEWSASILAHPYPYAASIDITITLSRPFDREKNNYCDTELPGLWDLTATNAQTSSAAIEEYCFNGTPIMVSAKPTFSDQPYKFRLSAIKTMNPAHMGDKNHTSNIQWERLILGQDLRKRNEANLFAGINVEGKLAEWKIVLSDSQRAGLNYLAHLPNNLGLVKGPWGTGKTKLDVVVAMLLMSANKKIKVLSPTNKAADSFTIKLLAELARLEKIGVVLTNKHVVRFHSPETEESVLKVDSQKFVTHDITKSRWQPAPPSSTFDEMAMRIFEQDRERVAGIPDRRYQVHAASLGTLILKVAGLADRPNPNDTSASPESRTTTDGKCTTEASETQNDREPERSTNGSTIHVSGDGHKDGRTQDDSDRSNEKASESDNHNEPAKDTHYSDDDNELSEQEYDSENGVPRQTPQQLKEQQEFEKAIQEQCREKIAKALGQSPLEKLINLFREVFLAIQTGVKTREEWAIYTSIEKSLSQELMRNNIAVLVTTLVNSGNTIVTENFLADHTIIQEAGKAENGDVFIALAHSNHTVHLSGDNMQLGPPEKEPERNPFANQVNWSFFSRLLSLRYPACELIEQHRTIPIITSVISRIWYEGKVVSTVNQDLRPNVPKIMQAHKKLLRRATPMVWVDTEGQTRKMGYSRSSQNLRELQVAIKLCEQYLDEGIKAEEIVILAGYVAQVNLTKRALAVSKRLRNVDSGTIDGYQGEEKSITIMCMVGSERLGFMALSPRLLTGVSRAADGLVIISNSKGIMVGENKRKRHQYDALMQMFKGQNNGLAVYSDPLPELDFTFKDLEATAIDVGKDDSPSEEDPAAHGEEAPTTENGNIASTQGGGAAAGVGGSTWIEEELPAETTTSGW